MTKLMPTDIHLSPVRRAGRLLMLLREPRTLDELLALLGVSPAQLRADLRELREEGWPIESVQTYVEAVGDTKMVRRGPKIVQLAVSL